MVEQRLTKKEREVWLFIIEFFAENKFTPTGEEIAKNFNLKSRQSAHYFLKNIAKKGYLKLGRKWRDIEIIIEPQKTYEQTSNNIGKTNRNGKRTSHKSS